MTSNLDEKLLKRKANQVLAQGISKQEAYEQLVAEFGHPDTTATLLRHIPSRMAWKKYGVWNHLLSGLMILLFLMMVLLSPTIGTFLWYGLLLFTILTRKTRFYYWIAILAIIGTLTIVAIAIASSGGITVDGIIRVSLFFALLLPSTFLAIWLPKKLTPEPQEEREYYENESGEQRSRIIFKFPE